MELVVLMHHNGSDCHSLYFRGGQAPYYLGAGQTKRTEQSQQVAELTEIGIIGRHLA